MIYFELFYVFFLIGLFTFGGGYAMIPMIQGEVQSRGWLAGTSLSDFIAISESTPGPFAINIATFIGSQTGGVFGAICATVGVALPSFIIILLVAMILKRFLNNKYVVGALDGIKPVVIALIASTAITFLIKALLYGGNDLFSQTVIFDKTSFALLVVLSAFYIIWKKGMKKSLNPVALIGIAALLGLILFI